MHTQNYTPKEIFAIATEANVVGAVVAEGAMLAGTVLADVDGTAKGFLVVSATAHLSETASVAALHVYEDDRKERELEQGEQYSYEDGVITLEGDAVGLTEIFATYTYGESAAEKEEHLFVAIEANGPAIGILAEDHLDEAPSEVAVAIAGYVRRDVVIGLSPAVEGGLHDIKFVD